jgi:arylsulfatase A-like enzyme
LDVQREKRAMRERYGLTLFGQSCLAARRLVEAGARFVSVFWDPYGPHGASVWDTHSNHFPRLRNYLLPVFDQSFSALIGDMDERGLLDETLVICTSEHGRTPQIDSGPSGGARHHWSRAYSTVFAGGGVARGRVVGSTDAQGGDVVDVPVSPKDMQATAYALLGYGEETTVPDQAGRPMRISGGGRVREELLS